MHVRLVVRFALGAASCVVLARRRLCYSEQMTNLLPALCSGGGVSEYGTGTLFVICELCMVDLRWTQRLVLLARW